MINLNVKGFLSIIEYTLRKQKITLVFFLSKHIEDMFCKYCEVMRGLN